MRTFDDEQELRTDDAAQRARKRDEDVATGARRPDAMQLDRLVATTTAAAGTTTTSTANRLTAWQDSESFGERFVGTSTEKRIYAPWNTSKDEAQASVLLNGDGFTLESPSRFTLLPTSNTQSAAYQGSYSPLLRFAPSKPGAFAATLTVEVAWFDGHVEKQSMTISGVARGIDQVTERGELPEETGAASEELRAAAELAGEAITNAADGKTASDEDVDAFDRASGQAARHAAHLTEDEAAGIDIAEKEVDHYQREVAVEEPSLWWGLLDVALTMAIGGVAGAVAKRIGPKIKDGFVKAASEVGGSAAKDAVEKASAVISDFATDAMKDGMKATVKLAIERLGRPGTAITTGDKRKKRHRHSADGQIEFFASQQKVIRSANAGYQTLVEERAADLSPLLAVAPKQAVRAMRDIGDAFVETQQDAEQAHADAAAIQWVALVARSNLGTDELTEDELAPGVDADRVVDATTDLTSARKASTNPKAIDGLVDIWVDESNGTPEVTKVRLHGISFSIIERMMDVPLADLRVPIRFNVAPAAKSDRRSVVTVDEALRVRAGGDYEALGDHVPRESSAPAKTEIEAHPGTMALTDSLLSKTLRSFSVAIDEDDARGDVE